MICIIGLPIYGEAKHDIEDPELVLLGLLMDKELLIYEKEDAMYHELESDLTKLICTGSDKTYFKFSDGFKTEDEIPEQIIYFAFNDQYFFKKYSSKWIILEDIKFDDASFSWEYTRYNKPLGDTDLSFLLEDSNDEINLNSASEKIFINRETGYFYIKEDVYLTYPGQEINDVEINSWFEGVCKLPGTNKF